ncbi:uncharacterized protein LOC119767236 isoform X2 [Culex quinquefasciatus]|uniref:uncharacterized protein LOC119767236 isoform X2 n=1 Tax=Culex quinquefasciatus TaxID=7176 RepID=UPI0018E32BAF|nr:uncharacterized protein LOC119767236 isoform X2 [Culex quinquefasciatus]
MAQTILVGAFCAAFALFGASSALPFELYQVHDDYADSTADFFLTNLKYLCIENTGSEAGYEKAINSMDSTAQCLGQNVNFMRMILNVNVPDTLEARQPLYGRYCPALHESVVCFNEAMEGVAMCTKGNVSLTVLMEKKIVHNLIDLICKNNGQFMLEFDAYLDYARLNSKQCKVSNILQSTPFTDFGQYGCSEVKRARACIQEQVSAFCSTSTLFELMDAILVPIMEVINCDKHDELLEMSVVMS